MICQLILLNVTLFTYNDFGNMTILSAETSQIKMHSHNAKHISLHVEIVKILKNKDRHC